LPYTEVRQGGSGRVEQYIRRPKPLVGSRLMKRAKVSTMNDIHRRMRWRYVRNRVIEKTERVRDRPTLPRICVVVDSITWSLRGAIAGYY
jgi:hypothetical protein